jgi:phosphopantothenoylcysteine synthetase/decarboxylase
MANVLLGVTGSVAAVKTPDLFAALRAATPSTLRVGAASVPGVAVAALAVIALSVFPGLAWALAR